MTQTFLRWGLLSTARINRVINQALKASPSNQLMAVASRSSEKASAYAHEWKIPKAYGSYDELLRDPEIDVIYNSLPNHLHAEWSIKCLEAGKHVLCEKPLALVPEDVDRIQETSLRTGKLVMEGFMYRHHPQTARVLELIDQGAIGKLQFIRGTFTFQIKNENDIRLIKEFGGGSIWDVGCYPLSFSRLIVGQEPEKVIGSAVMNQAGVDESFFGQLVFPDGVVTQFNSGFRSPARTNMEVVGSDGFLFIPEPFKPGEKYSFILQRKKDVEKIKGKGTELYSGEIENLSKSIINQTAPLISLDDSKANIRTISALLNSADSGNWVKLD